MADISNLTISQLQMSERVDATDLFEVAKVSATSETGYASVKATAVQIGNFVNTVLQYSSDLTTTDKRIVGAINELKASVDDLISRIEVLEGEGA